MTALAIFLIGVMTGGALGIVALSLLVRQGQSDDAIRADWLESEVRRLRGKT